MNSRFLMLSIILLLVSCANPDKDWQLASRDDSQNAYLEFLAKHPDSQFADQARLRISELKVIHAWERAEFKDTLTGYAAFLKNHADSEFVPAANQRVRELQRDEEWESIGANKVALESFIAEYPDAPQAVEARAQLDTILAAEEAAKPRERPGNFRLQLAAFRTVAAAEAELRRLVELAPDTLLGPIRIEAPANDQGMFILKSVPMNSTEAREACARLIKIGQNCLIINR